MYFSDDITTWEEKKEIKVQWLKVEREDEGLCSSRPQLAAFLLAFRDPLIEELVVIEDSQ